VAGKTLEMIGKACKDKKHIKLTVGAINADGKQSIKVFGENGQIENKDYIYEIGSITKTFTASLFAKYFSEGKISLDDSISKYINGLDSEQYHPTLRRLATHTAGYSGSLPLTGKEMVELMFEMMLGGRKQGVFPFDVNFGEMKRILKENKLEDKDYPWQYSNFGMALLGYAVGEVSGKGYHESMNEFCAEDLGLKNTYTGTCAHKNLHGFNRKNQNIGNWIWSKDYMAPAGDISSTAADLLEYARINMLEEKPYLALCHQKHLDSRRCDMGLGWILDRKNNNVLWHSGGTGAFSSYLALDKEKKLAVVVLANYRMMPDRIGSSILKNQQRKGVLAVD